MADARVTQAGAYVETRGNLARVTQMGAYVEVRQLQVFVSQMGAYVEVLATPTPPVAQADGRFQGFQRPFAAVF